MNNIAPIGRPAASESVLNPDPAVSPPANAAQHRPADQVELSAAAQLLGRLDDLPDVREDLVARVREQILDGTYETEEKLDAAVSELENDLQDLA